MGGQLDKQLPLRELGRKDIQLEDPLPKESRSKEHRPCRRGREGLEGGERRERVREREEKRKKEGRREGSGEGEEKEKKEKSGMGGVALREAKKDFFCC